MTDRPQVAATLTDEQLATVVALAPHEPIEAIVTVWRTICPEWETLAQGELRPWDYSLPHDQWTAIGSALAEYRHPSPLPGLAGVNLLLDWMNKGPSARDEGQP
jgi:hypothetical protein